MNKPNSVRRTVNLNDDAARDAWYRDLTTGLDDMDGVVTDMLRPPTARELGPVYHREIYGEARVKVTALLAMIVRNGDDLEPAGSTDPDATPTGELDEGDPPDAALPMT
jgi:hypothetical protein